MYRSIAPAQTSFEQVDRVTFPQRSV